MLLSAERRAVAIPLTYQLYTYSAAQSQHLHVHTINDRNSVYYESSAANSVQRLSDTLNLTSSMRGFVFNVIATIGFQWWFEADRKSQSVKAQHNQLTLTIVHTKIVLSAFNIYMDFNNILKSKRE